MESQYEHVDAEESRSSCQEATPLLMLDESSLHSVPSASTLSTATITTPITNLNHNPNHNNDNNAPPSPFFRPSTPKLITQITTVATPNGTHSYKHKQQILTKKSGVQDVLESKSTIFGACANLVNTIVGAGIIGMPYAICKCGLIMGIILILFVAFLANTSLGFLIQMGKYAKVNSYELLMEAAFGRKGFIFISINMFIINYGGMIAFLSIIKDTIPSLLGIENDDEWGKGTTLIATTLLIIFPLSMQRDMADLSKTSTISVIMVLLMTTIVVTHSPIQQSIEAHGGLYQMIQQSSIHPQTLFVGLGVLSFGFVCQDASFIIAGSLDQPTVSRWKSVTGYSISTCAILAIILGVAGYLGFLDDTQGNILNNFPTDVIIPMDQQSMSIDAINDQTNVSSIDFVLGSIETHRAITIARALLGLTMFLVYPITSFIARHVIVVLLFEGRRAHEGDDHSVLARTDRRIALTFFLYVIAIIPALLCQDLGSILAVSGAVGGSCLSYLGPGAAYLGIHGGEFLKLIMKYSKKESYVHKWMWKYPMELKLSPGTTSTTTTSHHDFETQRLMPFPSSDEYNQGVGLDIDIIREQKQRLHVQQQTFSILHCISSIFSLVTWYTFCMPLWCAIASEGNKTFLDFIEKEKMKSPAPKRILVGNTTSGSSRLSQRRAANERPLSRNNSPAMGGRGASVGPGRAPVIPRPLLLDDERQHSTSLRHSASDSNFQLLNHSISDTNLKLLPPPSSLRLNKAASNHQQQHRKTNNPPASTSPFVTSYGSSGSINKVIGEQLSMKESEIDLKGKTPRWTNFLLAIGYIILGFVALSAGIWSIFVS